jgi:hypothetical protein
MEIKTLFHQHNTEPENDWRKQLPSIMTLNQEFNFNCFPFHSRNNGFTYLNVQKHKQFGKIFINSLTGKYSMYLPDEEVVYPNPLIEYGSEIDIEDRNPYKQTLGIIVDELEGEDNQYFFIFVNASSVILCKKGDTPVPSQMQGITISAIITYEYLSDLLNESQLNSVLARRSYQDGKLYLFFNTTRLYSLQGCTPMLNYTEWVYYFRLGNTIDLCLSIENQRNEYIQPFPQMKYSVEFNHGSLSSEEIAEVLPKDYFNISYFITSTLITEDDFFDLITEYDLRLDKWVLYLPTLVKIPEGIVPFFKNFSKFFNEQEAFGFDNEITEIYGCRSILLFLFEFMETFREKKIYLDETYSGIYFEYNETTKTLSPTANGIDLMNRLIIQWIENYYYKVLCEPSRVKNIRKYLLKEDMIFSSYNPNTKEITTIYKPYGKISGMEVVVFVVS